MAGPGLDSNRFHRYVIRNIQEDKHFKGYIIKSSLIEVWNPIRKIITQQISLLTSPLSASPFGDNYSKKNEVLYADMVHPGSMNKLKT